MAKSVVIIDDSKFLIKQVADFFEKELGFKVVGQGLDGNDAVALFREHKPDLLTLDITMPNKDGYDALLEILQEFPNAKILMVSAVRGDAMLACMSAGAKGYVEKPLKLTDAEYAQDFKETVNEALK